MPVLVGDGHVRAVGSPLPAVEGALHAVAHHPAAVADVRQDFPDGVFEDLLMEAAVSSIDRRVTSITGHRLRVHSRREYATSCAI